MDTRADLERLIPDLSHGEWALLEDDGYVGEVESGACGVDYLAERVKRVRRRLAEGSRTERPGETADPAELARRASTRAEALSALLASDASRRDDVAAFRRKTLRGKLLRLERVGEWIERRSREGEPVRRLILGEPWEVDAGAEGREWIGGRPVMETQTPMIEYATPGDRNVRYAATSSKLAGLRPLSHALASAYGWQPAQATVFVLTGLTPIVPSIRTRAPRKAPIGAVSRIVLEVDPTVTPKEVEQRYAEARRRFLGGRRSRRMSEKHLRLAIFADAHSEGTWEERMAAWNAEFPQDRYSDYRQFHRDAAGAVRRLLGAPFGG